jgi:crotonobetainyl-CoA:carnitine CoA-transferase CaiB-like acyl-CoA transferase
LIPFEETYLRGLRVLEIADERGEYVGKVLAGLGADVVKIEPPTGEETRGYGPFYHDEPDRERSLHFWQFNLAKRSVVLDLDTAADQAQFRALAAVADVIVDARLPAYMDERELGYASLAAANPGLIYLRVTPFGDDGPWRDYVGSDIVHLALGGMIANCGYDPDPQGFYETPPIAPQAWLAYQTAGEVALISLLAALNYRFESGKGQHISASIHGANAGNTELDIPYWLILRTPLRRFTGRHARATLSVRALAETKDGRYVVPYATYIQNFPSSWDADISTLRKYGMQADLDDECWEDPAYRAAHQPHLADVMDKLIRRTTYDTELWREMLDKGTTWAPVRRPEENLQDEHWRKRHIFHEVPHPELDETFTYVGARWVSDQVSWRLGPRAPRLGEHTAAVRDEWTTRRVERSTRPSRPVESSRRVSKHGKPFALSSLRVLDLSWMLASAGAGRFLAAMGAEVIKVEHRSHLDGMRFAGTTFPPGGRAERDAATEPLTPRPQQSVNDSASFTEINCGKLSLALNLRDDRGKQIFKDLVRESDVVIEGYSPGTLERMGFGYDVLRELNPQIVYVHQSGLGNRGDYGRAKTFGPTAQAFSGMTEMSGLPTPWPPAGIGYSYLDWFGAYNVTTAVLAALYRLNATGEGCYVDGSQVECGIFLAGIAVLDHTVNGRTWSRHGNRSPYKAAAPHGVYRTEGDDRWIAIAAFTEEQWQATVDVLGQPGWAAEPRFETLETRLENQEELDRLLDRETQKQDRYALMDALQARGVPAGVVQDAQDRIDFDPQLDRLGWLRELPQTDNGVWPVRENPIELSETPTYMGGFKDRSGPNYGEDTEEVLSSVLGYGPEQIRELRDAGVL